MVNMGGGGSPRHQHLQRSGAAAATTRSARNGWQTLLASVKIARSGLPEIVPVTEFRDVFGIALTNMIQGADPAGELRKATEAFKPVLAKSLKT